MGVLVRLFSYTLLKSKIKNLCFAAPFIFILIYSPKGFTTDNCVDMMNSANTKLQQFNSNQKNCTKNNNISKTIESPCELKVGTSKSYNTDDDSSPSSRAQNYRLTRTSEKVYLAEINLSFFKDSNFNTHESSQELQNNMYKKINRCLNEVNPYLKGPDGKSLKIKLTRSTNVPEINVLISNNERANTGKFSYKIECSSIFHEIMHYLGLVDEYPETVNGYFIDPKTGEVLETEAPNKSKRLAKDCRHLGPIDSVMNKHKEAFEVARSTNHFKVKVCFCKKFNCKEMFEKVKPIPNLTQNCPENLYPSYYEKESQDSTPEEEYFERNDYLIGYELVRSDPPKKESLLLPAQFNVITSPDCLEKNSTYNECSKNASRTSIENYGQGCLKSLPACDDKDFKWLK